MEIDDGVTISQAESGKTVVNIKKGKIMLKWLKKSRHWQAWIGHSQVPQVQQPAHLSHWLRSSVCDIGHLSISSWGQRLQHQWAQRAALCTRFSERQSGNDEELTLIIKGTNCRISLCLLLWLKLKEASAAEATQNHHVVMLKCRDSSKHPNPVQILFLVSFISWSSSLVISTQDSYFWARFSAGFGLFPQDFQGIFWKKPSAQKLQNLLWIVLLLKALAWGKEGLVWWKPDPTAVSWTSTRWVRRIRYSLSEAFWVGTSLALYWPKIGGGQTCNN